MFKGIIQTILVVFSMKTSRACTDMLSSENYDFKSLKLRKHKKHVHYVHHSSRARETVLSAVDQEHERKSSHRAVLYFFQNIELEILATFH